MGKHQHIRFYWQPLVELIGLLLIFIIIVIVTISLHLTISYIEYVYTKDVFPNLTFREYLKFGKNHIISPECQNPLKSTNLVDGPRGVMPPGPPKGANGPSEFDAQIKEKQ